jgi:hypothetical protein
MEKFIILSGLAAVAVFVAAYALTVWRELR